MGVKNSVAAPPCSFGPVIYEIVLDAFCKFFGFTPVVKDTQHGVVSTKRKAPSDVISYLIPKSNPPCW